MHYRALSSQRGLLHFVLWRAVLSNNIVQHQTSSPPTSFLLPPSSFPSCSPRQGGLSAELMDEQQRRAVHPSLAPGHAPLSQTLISHQPERSHP